MTVCKKCGKKLEEKTVEIEVNGFNLRSTNEFTFFVCPDKCQSARDIYLDLADEKLKALIEEDWEQIKGHLEELPDYEEDDDLPQIYFDWNWIGQEWVFTDICMCDYYPHGMTSTEGLFSTLVDKHTTKEDLLDQVVSENVIYDFIPEDLEKILEEN